MDEGKASDSDGSLGGRGGKGDSGGGAYPNPHTGKEGEGDAEGYMGHGGQTEMPYHGTGRLGEESTGENPNVPTKDHGGGGDQEPG